MKVDLDEVRAMLAAATPGPWRPCPSKCFVFGPNHEMIASRSRVQDEGDPELGTVEIRGFGAGLPMDANHDLIVAAPTLISAMADEIARLRSLLPAPRAPRPCHLELRLLGAGERCGSCEHFAGDHPNHPSRRGVDG